MILKNAEIFNENFDIVRSDILISGKKIKKIAPDIEGEDAADLSGCIITPGFVDIHIHGCMGADTCDGTEESIAKMSAGLLKYGVTSFCPTTMTVSAQKIKKAIAAVKKCMEHPPEGASALGVNMEGPYISKNRRGAQKVDYVRKPDWQEFKRLYDSCGGIIKLVDIAPECDIKKEFIDHASKFCRVSLAHTDADYEQAKDSFHHGIKHVTHLFNAMNGLHHRRPGAVGAVFDDDCVKAEIICDGFHIHPAVLRTTFRLLGEDRTVIISDSMRAAGMPDGLSELGGQKVYVKDGIAKLADGTIAGSTTNIHQEIKNLIGFGIPLRQVIKSATINPAKEVGVDGRIGSICDGKDADLTVMDKDWNIIDVIKFGKLYKIKG